MRRFFIRLLFFIALPALIITLYTGFYIKRDIYLDFGPYKNYSWKYYYQSLGDLSTKKLLNSPVKYNSFLLGSSRITGLYACYLQKQIKNSRFFLYANWDETIGGIYAKLHLLDSLGYKLDNVIMYMDSDDIFSENGDCKPNDHYLLIHENKYFNLWKHYWSMVPIPFDLAKSKIILGFTPTGKEFPDWEADPVRDDGLRIV